MKTSLTILAGVLALTARSVSAQDTLTSRRHRLLVNIKGGFSVTTYTGGGYIGSDTDLTTEYSGGLSGQCA